MDWKGKDLIGKKSWTGKEWIGKNLCKKDRIGMNLIVKDIFEMVRLERIGLDWKGLN